MSAHQQEIATHGWMRQSVELAAQSVAEGDRTSVAPSVGVVIVKDGKQIGESYRGRTGKGQHAEYGLLQELEGVDLTGATVFTTLEPCSRRGTGKRPCAEWLVERGVSTAYIGMYDPNPEIYREGWRCLRDHGIELRDYPSGLRAELSKLNSGFIGQYRMAVGPTGSATFDYEQNDGKYSIFSDPDRVLEFETQWTQRGAHSIYAYDARNHVALARYAHEFSEIDDPGALDFGNYSEGANEREIVVFRKDSHYLLVRIEKVYAGTDGGDDRTELQITFEVRMGNKD